MHWWERKL